MYNKTTQTYVSVIMVSACYTVKVKLIVAVFTFFCVYTVPFNPHTWRLKYTSWNNTWSTTVYIFKLTDSWNLLIANA